MHNSSFKTYTATELASRWGYKSSSSVLRVMHRFGCSGAKFGKSKQSGRRFTDHEVTLVEKLVGLHVADNAQYADGEGYAPQNRQAAIGE